MKHFFLVFSFLMTSYWASSQAILPEKDRAALVDALLQDPRVWSFDVNVDSDYGLVTRVPSGTTRPTAASTASGSSTKGSASSNRTRGTKASQTWGLDGKPPVRCRECGGQMQVVGVSFKPITVLPAHAVSYLDSG